MGTCEYELRVKGDVVLPLTHVFMGTCLAIAALLAITQPIPFAENPLLIRIFMGWVGLPLAAAIIVMSARRIVLRGGAIVVDAEGIADRTGPLAPGLIRWNQIQEVYLLKLKDNSFLCVVPKDYDAWLAGLSRGRRRLAQANIDADFAPIRIQFEKATHAVRAEDGLAVARRLHPELITRVRKPRY